MPNINNMRDNHGVNPLLTYGSHTMHTHNYEFDGIKIPNLPILPPKGGSVELLTPGPPSGGKAPRGPLGDEGSDSDDGDIGSLFPNCAGGGMEEAGGCPVTRGEGAGSGTLIGSSPFVTGSGLVLDDSGLK